MNRPYFIFLFILCGCNLRTVEIPHFGITSDELKSQLRRMNPHAIISEHEVDSATRKSNVVFGDSVIFLGHVSDLKCIFDKDRLTIVYVRIPSMQKHDFEKLNKEFAEYYNGSIGIPMIDKVDRVSYYVQIHDSYSGVLSSDYYPKGDSCTIVYYSGLRKYREALAPFQIGK